MTLTAYFCLLLALPAFAQTASPPANVDPLRSAFLTPPAAARPRVWWHWMNGNVTEEGIRLDLEWMKQRALAVFKTSTPHWAHRKLWTSAWYI